jgi:hypothetical protein
MFLLEEVLVSSDICQQYATTLPAYSIFGKNVQIQAALFDKIESYHGAKNVQLRFS